MSYADNVALDQYAYPAVQPLSDTARCLVDVTLIDRPEDCLTLGSDVVNISFDPNPFIV